MKPETRESTDAADVARLLKPPAERVLPGSRHRLLKEYLMQEITHESQASAKPRRPRRRVAYFAAPLATAGALAVVVTLATGNGPSHPGGSGLGTPPPDSATSNTTTTLLGKIADAAASKPLPSVRDDQFVYVESKVAFEVDTADGSGYHQALEKLHLRQIWQSVNNSRVGLLREGSPDLPLPAGRAPGLGDPDFRYLETLPTDPVALLKMIYAGAGATASAAPGDGASVLASGAPSASPVAGAPASGSLAPSVAASSVPSGSGSGSGSGSAAPSINPRTLANVEAFQTIGELLREQIAPPKVTAALYKAAAMIPGVRVVNDVEDVTGRHDIAVAMDNGTLTYEWLFNKGSLGFIGEQDVSLTAGPLGPAGSITGTQIALTRAIVDQVGETPTK